MIVQITLLLAALSSTLASAAPVPRETALQHLNESIASVRKHASTGSSEMGKVLVTNLARPAGDDPRVLAVCDEIVSNSTDTYTIVQVADAINTMLVFHRQVILKQGRIGKVAALIRRLTASENLDIRLRAARVFRLLGPKYAAERISVYTDIFRAASTATLDDHARWELIRAIQETIDSTAPDLRAAIRDLSEKQGLVKFLEDFLNDQRIPGRGQGLDRLLKKWKALK
jgi:hypothetical protein